MSKWIDFKTLRQKLSFAAVLELYEVELKVKSDGQAHGFCPLPTHDGEQRSPSFSAHMLRGVWQCFGCGAKGNVLDFAICMEGLSPDKSADVRTVAVKLKDQFHIDCEVDRPPRETRTGSPGKNGPGKPRIKRAAKSDTDAKQPALIVDGEDSPPDVKINEPLDFELKGLQADHPYLIGRGFTAETMWRFGVGYCGRGSLAGRIAIPLFDHQDRLIGYAGRVVNDATITEENPKYRFPSRRERNGSVLEFRKSHLVYNASRLEAPVDTLVVVEGFPSVWWLTQAGIPNVVAVMGASMSPEQAATIKQRTTPDARVW
jgi:DNA primase